MKENNLTKSDVKSIISDELKKYHQNELENDLKKLISKQNSGVRNEVLDIVKKALHSAYKFMYIRKDVWTNEIK